nr:hypothetical protein GCM10020092_068230 [Actinoplanes digitatis]
MAREMNATNLPSAEIDGLSLALLPCVPAEARLTRSVLPVCRSRTKMSEVRLVSPGTSVLDSDEKATYRPSAESAGSRL